MQELQRQLEELQTQFAFQEDVIHALNRTVAEQQLEISLLHKRIDALKALVDDTVAELEQARPSERPPHY